MKCEEYILQQYLDLKEKAEPIMGLFPDPASMHVSTEHNELVLDGVFVGMQHTDNLKRAIRTVLEEAAGYGRGDTIIYANKGKYHTTHGMSLEDGIKVELNGVTGYLFKEDLVTLKHIRQQIDEFIKENDTDA